MTQLLGPAPRGFHLGIELAQELQACDGEVDEGRDGETIRPWGFVFKETAQVSLQRERGEAREPRFVGDIWQVASPTEKVLLCEGG